MIGRAAFLVLVAVMGLGVVRAMAPIPGPVTPLHYAPNANFSSDGTYRPGRVGFNLADVSSPRQLAALPPGVRALVWVGQCEGVTERFRRTVSPYLGRPEVFGFYLMDDPDPRWQPTPGGPQQACPEQNLNAETDWIHVHMPGARTFIVVMNLASPDHPRFDQGYDLARLRVDLVGVDPYPCRSERGRCDYGMINRYVARVEAEGIPARRIVPVYQSFGGGQWQDGSGGTYVVPTRRQEARILAQWGSLVPHPVFDYAYSWGAQRHDHSIDNYVPLQDVFRRHNVTSDGPRPSSVP
jgi:hypothetical protein